MSKPKKITYNELMDRNLLLLQKTVEMQRAIDYLHTLLLSYIECNNHQEKLKKYLEENNKNEQTNGSDPNGNREDKPGDTPIDTESTEARDKSKTRTNKAQAQKYC